MHQLNQTGYMHNRLRMVVASFLTKDLGIDWRWGERYFAEKLAEKGCRVKSKGNLSFALTIARRAAGVEIDVLADDETVAVLKEAEETTRGRPGAQRLAVTSGGTIPDRGLFTVTTPGGADGRLWAEENPGCGSVFRFTLPAAPRG